MHARRAPHDRAVHVTIVSGNPHTVAALERYLGAAGVSTDRTLDLARCSELAPGSSAIVLFPDDFATTAVLDAVTPLLARVPPVFLVLVTRTPQRFATLGDPARRSQDGPVVLPRPAWGFTILDALRSRIAPEPEDDDAS
ncbi:MAG: hypothetical protein IT379_22965 [Deltaproteobacteria bacterium]|nr:hypothetical protein [Deltaproteobacteria bacterium]